MAALESPFDGLLSCSSVFVRPNPNMAPDRYGQQHTDDQYSHVKVADSHVGGGGHDLEEDPVWRWAGPTDTGERADDLLVDPEREPAYATAGEPHQHQHQHQQSYSARGKENGSASSPERLDVGYGSGDSHLDGEEDRSWVRGADDGNLKDGDDNVVQHGAPSPVVGAVAASPPSALRSFEDQPIRGLARVEEMSLDELIAQGERQMQESQARTALAKPPIPAAAVGGVGYSRSNSPPISATGANRSAPAVRSEFDGSDNGEGHTKRDSSIAFADGGVSGTNISRPPRTEMRESLPRGASTSHRVDDSNNATMRSSTASLLAWGDGSGIGGGGGLRASLRSGTSFATSWSGGDPEQLRHLSMGVMPAAAETGDGGGEEESREEREQREFHELEMELLREEERGGGRGEGAVEGNGQHERRNEDDWDEQGGDSYAITAGGRGNGEGRRDGLEERSLGWEHHAVGSDNANQAAAGRYQAFSENVGVESAGAGAGYQPISPRSLAQRRDTGDGVVQASGQSGELLPRGGGEDESAWQEDERRVVRGRSQPGHDNDEDDKSDPGQGYGANETEVLVGADDDKDTRRWEAEEDGEGYHGDGWPVQERDEWGRTAMRRDSNARGASQHVHQQQEQQLSIGDGTDALGAASSTPRRPHRLVHTPPPSPPPGAAGAVAPHTGAASHRYGISSTADAQERRKDDKHGDAFGDDEAWGDVDTAPAASAAASAVRGASSTRNGSVGHQQGLPNGVGVGGPGAPWSKKRPSAEIPVPPPPAGGAPKGAPSQSKLVQRVFGGRGRRGGGRGGRGRGTATGRGRGRSVGGQNGGDGDGDEEGGSEPGGGGAGGSWAVQAELQGKLRELEEEVARYKEENERARLARRKQETALAEVMRKRQEVREWAEAERAAVEAWCTEQRQASAREKRAALKQVQGLRARALAGGGLGGGTATERRQRQEMEGLKATIERAKLDAETAKKKARASERRLQQQIKAGAERVAELEGQVSFLERQRVEVWASSTGDRLGGAPVGAGRASKASGTPPPGLSRSMTGGGSVGARRSTAANGGARSTRGALGATGPAEGSATTAGAGGRRSGWSWGRKDEHERENEYYGRDGREVSSGGGPTEVGDAAREDRGREHGGRGDARLHHENTARFSEGGVTVTPGRRRQGEGDDGLHVGSGVSWGVSVSRANGNGRSATRRNEGDGPQQQHRWAREAGGGGDGGYSGGWSEQAVEVEEEEEEEVEEIDIDGGRHFDFKSGGGRGVAPPVTSRDPNDIAEPPLDGVQRASGEREERRFRHRQQPGRRDDWHYPNAPASSRRVGDEQVGQVEGQEDVEAFVEDRGDTNGRHDNGGNGNGSKYNAPKAPLGSSWDARTLATSSDGVKYDPLRYEKAVSCNGPSHHAAAAAASGSGGEVEGGEAGTTTGGYPDALEAGGGMRHSSSDGRQAARAAAQAESLDRSSALRHSEGAGMARVEWAGEAQRSREVVGRGAADVGDGSGGVHSRSGEGGEGNGGAEPAGWRDPNDGREEHGGGNSSALAGSRNGPPERVPWQPAATQMVSVGGSTHDGRGYPDGRKKKAGMYGSAAGAMGGPDQPAAAAAAAATAATAAAAAVLTGGGVSVSSGAVRGSGGRSGGKVEHVLRDGRRVILFANGTQKEMLPDGGCVVRFVNGDLKRVEGGTGVVVYTYAAARTTHTMHPSGLEVFEFPSGQVERHHKTGEKEIDFPDGTRKYILPSGREMSEFPDGVTVVEYPEGHRDVTSPNGTTHRERPDGTVETPASES